ncbi:SsgA family sporulation/cell division regulator [Streptomyces sp. YU58]|uniref:SsgA family sporulation/cell division regulator n=1 Tax=Streptomyces sp. SX92 TaxID=3158972 RepID=UPI0027B8F26D|nr:SsgA family sporulation/cell division regulator [Streptomyces coralus]WLW57268.1 SsgA family sporulation/cell division regulator [Streptomyces coralus]
MSGNQPDRQTRRAVSDGRPELVLDIERVLDLTTRQAVRAEFRFDPDAPWVVSVELAVEGGPRVLWRISRDLLHEGLHSVSGLGDVQIWPSHTADRATARLQLTSRDTAALFELPVPPLAEWLADTYELVPADAELSEIDWDAATAGLFQEPQAHCD